MPAVKPIATEEAVLAIVAGGLNNMASANDIARLLEKRHGRKAGSMHLAVKLCMRRLEAKGKIVVLPPKDQWGSYILCLPHDECVVRQRLSDIKRGRIADQRREVH